MSFNVQTFKERGLRLGGARPSQFEVMLPSRMSPDLDRFLVQATSLPASTIGTIEVPYFGRKIKIAGDRTFAEWQTTVLNDEDFRIRNAVELWISDINAHRNNFRNGPVDASPASYKYDADVIQYGKTNSKLMVYTFVGLYPSEVSTIELDWNSTDAVETFTITWQYDYWVNKNALV